MTAERMETECFGKLKMSFVLAARRMFSFCFATGLTVGGRTAGSERKPPHPQEF